MGLWLAFTALLACVLTGNAFEPGWRVLSHLCHQNPDRSLVVADHQLGICWRCLGIYLGVWSSLLFGVARRLAPQNHVRKILSPALLCLIPMEVDVYIKLAMSWSTPGPLRASVGFLYGLGCGLLMTVLLSLLPRHRAVCSTAAGRGPFGARASRLWQLSSRTM